MPKLPCKKDGKRKKKQKSVSHRPQKQKQKKCRACRHGVIPMPIGDGIQCPNCGGSGWLS